MTPLDLWLLARVDKPLWCRLTGLAYEYWAAWEASHKCRRARWHLGQVSWAHEARRLHRAYRRAELRAARVVRDYVTELMQSEVSQ